MRRGAGPPARILLVAAALAVAGAPLAGATDFTALYDAYWAGLPAGEIRIAVHDRDDSYRDVVSVASVGLPRLFTHFRGVAASDGRLHGNRPPQPTDYRAIYDLRNRRNKHLSMEFHAREGALFADRGADDTSGNPPLAERFRKNVVDPVSALAAIRQALRRSRTGAFVIPVYDGARRFDVDARVLPREAKTPGVLRLDLTLRAIAGFHGKKTTDDDPDDAPRTVRLQITDDARLMPLWMTVPIYYLPLVVSFNRLCTAQKPCEQ